MWKVEWESTAGSGFSIDGGLGRSLPGEAYTDFCSEILHGAESGCAHYIVFSCKVLQASKDGTVHSFVQFVTVGHPGIRLHAVLLPFTLDGVRI